MMTTWTKSMNKTKHGRPTLNETETEDEYDENEYEVETVEDNIIIRRKGFKDLRELYIKRCIFFKISGNYSCLEAVFHLERSLQDYIIQVLSHLISSFLFFRLLL